MSKIVYPFAAIPNQVLRSGHGAINVAVLAVLMSHGKSTASAKTLAEEVGCDRKSVFSALAYWKKCGPRFGIYITTKGKEEGRCGLPTIIEIEITTCTENGTGMSEGCTENGTQGVPKTEHPPVPKTEHKEDNYKKTKQEDKDIAPPALETTVDDSDSKSIAEVFDIFRTSINPTVNFGNKTQRSAALELVKKFGLEKTLAAAKAAVAVHGRPYAPVITDPYQLKEKFARLVSYWERENARGPKTVKI